MRVINNRLWVETDTYVYTDNQCNVLTAKQLSNPDCTICVARMLIKTIDPYEYVNPNKPRHIRLQVALVASTDQGYLYRDNSAECMYHFLLKLINYSFSGHDVVCGEDIGITNGDKFKPYATVRASDNEWSKGINISDLDETSRYYTNGSSLPNYERIEFKSGRMVSKEGKLMFE